MNCKADIRTHNYFVYDTSENTLQAMIFIYFIPLRVGINMTILHPISCLSHFLYPLWVGINPLWVGIRLLEQSICKYYMTQRENFFFFFTRKQIAVEYGFRRGWLLANFAPGPFYSASSCM
jgi:hypothetical protein